MKHYTFVKFLLSMTFGLLATIGLAQTNIAPSATASASTCNTGPCSTLNDLDYGTCGTQSMWISTSSPPSTTPGVDWIQWDWSTPQTFDHIIIEHANGPVTSGRNLDGFLIQYWNGTTWVNHQTISNLPRACRNDVTINVLTASRFRITSFTMFPQGQLSNPNFREIEIIQAILIEDNAATLAIDSPAVFCEGTHNVVATIANRGINQLDSVRVNWTFDNVQQPTLNYTTMLDTLNGTGPTEAQVVLGTKSFVSGIPHDIKVWTSHPNGQPDTFNFDDTAAVTVQPAIFGNFTIDPNGTGTNNYTTFADAAQDLSDYGVCGPVVFTVTPGTYSEQVTLSNITGTSATNTITFMPDSNGFVTLEHTSNSTAANYTLGLDGASYVSFTNFIFDATGSSYATATMINGGASYNSFDNCVFNGYSNASTSSYQAVLYTQSANNNYNSFTNCEINGGSYGYYFYGGGTTSRNIGNEFMNCKFTDQYYRSMYAYYTTDLHFIGNEVTSSRNYSSMYACYFYYGNGDFQFVKNNVNTPGYMALYMVYVEGDNTNKPLIANNFLRVGRNSGTYGYGLYGSSIGFCRIVNNTVVTTHTSYTYYGMYISGGANTILNNNYYEVVGQNSGSYAALYFNGGFSVLECDHNNVYTKRAYGYFGGSYPTLADWQAGTGFGTNSLTSDPGFTNFDSLRTCSDTLDGAGTPLAYVLDDYDGDGRDPVTPDIGADEWVGSAPGSYSAGDDAIICAGSPIEIGLQVTGGVFAWNTGDTTSTITVNSQGSYTVVMTSACGASHGDTVVVEDATTSATFDQTVSFHTGNFDNTSDNGLSYMWVVHTIPSDTFYSKNLTHVFPDNGPYDVDLYVYGGCDTSMSSDTWMGTVGIEEGSLENMITLMPNPATDVVNIKFDGIEGDVTVEMTNIQGQLVHSDRFMNVSGNTETINVSSLKNGMYIVKFISNGEVATKQIIVQ
jgi:hypothetical protein